MKLRAKLLLLFFALAVLPMAGVGLFSYYNSLRTVEDVVENRNLTAAREAADALAQQINKRRRELPLLAQNQEIQHLYAARDKAGVPQRLQTFYGQFFQGARQAFVQLQYLDRDGNSILRYNGLATDPSGVVEPTLARTDTSATYFNLGPYQQDQLHVENHYLQNHGPVLRLGRWIESIDDGRRIGFLFADVSVERLVATTPLGQRTFARSVPVIAERSDSRILHHPQSHFVGGHFDQALPGGEAIYAQIKADSSGQARGDRHLFSYVNLDHAHWTVGLYTRLGAHTGPARRAGLINLGIALGGALLILLLTPLVVDRVTRSISRVTEGAEAIAAGDLDQQITVDSHDETRTLADAFNRMAQSLKTILDELEDRVDARTAELSTANDQLTLERATERVRAEALSMRESDDIKKVIVVAYKELLAYRDDLNGFAALMYDLDNNTRFTYHAGPAPDANTTWTSPGLERIDEHTAVTTIHTPISERPAESYARWRKGEIWHEYADKKKLQHMERETHDYLDIKGKLPFFEHDELFFVGFPFAEGEFGTSAPRPFSEEDIAVIQQFADAATIGYQRYLDFQRLEAQNRDLQTEQALERVRTEVAAMQQSDDLFKVRGVVQEALVELGVLCIGVSINTVDEDAGTYRLHGTDPDIGDGQEMNMDQVYLQHWKKRETFIRHYTPESVWDRYELAVAAGQIEDTEEARKDFRALERTIAEQGGHAWVVDVPFAHGALAMNKYGQDPFTNDHIHLLERFTEVFALGYRRYLDLEAAETRARAAAVDRALERVRAEVAAMRHIDDGEKAVRVLSEELLNVGVDFDAMGVSIFAHTQDNIYAWRFDPGLDSYRLQYFNELPQSEPGVDDLSQLMEHWKRGEVFHRRHLPGMVRQIVAGATERRGIDLDPEAEVWVVDVPFAYGTLAINRGWHRAEGKPFTDEEIDTIKRFADVVALSYVRFADFHQLEAQNQQLQEANEQIQEATRHKSQFLARMSHDLRTPMNAIIGYTRILLRRVKDQLEPRQFQNLENIQLSANNLLTLINDILDLSRIESGRVDLKPEAVDLPQLIDECAASVESLLKPGVELHREVADLAPLTTDADLLRRVVMNLLGNAVKFTENGHITLSASAHNGGIRLAVSDTGPGIPADELPHIFEEFRQVDGLGEVKVQEGSGLGLAIVRKSVELLGGTIEAQSAVGQGTTFTLQLENYGE